jgi:hypothetical protein
MKTSVRAYGRCVSIFTFVLALAQGVASAAFTAGPSVRVNPNISVEIRWSADFVGAAKVEIFDNPDGNGSPIVTYTGLPANDQTITIYVDRLIKADTRYYFKVTHSDNIRQDLTNGPAPYPPFFTGAQVISNVFADADVESAVISWDANVIGYGSVVYGTTALAQGPVEDSFNITRHAIELTGLSPGTTYQFRVSNKHAIDRTSLADATGQFTTRQRPVDITLTQPQADPRVIQPNARSTLRVRTLRLVWFAVDASSRGGGTFDGAWSAQATTDANGVASVQITGTGSGLVHVNVTAAQALNTLTMPVVVR